jgi:hypothetical protein
MTRWARTGPHQITSFEQANGIHAALQRVSESLTVDQLGLKLVASTTMPQTIQRQEDNANIKMRRLLGSTLRQELENGTSERFRITSRTIIMVDILKHNQLSPRDAFADRLTN